MAPLVSVVVPCFNYGPFLAPCIGSLIAQTHSRWECVIVDDGSTDETERECTRLSQADRRVRFIRQPNRGLSEARNAGIRSAKGELVQLLDADDLLEPAKLGSQVALLSAAPDIDIVVGPAATFSSKSPQAPRNWLPRWNRAWQRAREGAVLEEIVKENFFPVNAAMTRRSVFDARGFFDPALPAHEDWDFWIRCALHGTRFWFVASGRDRALVRHHGLRMSAARELMWRTGIIVRERIHGDLPAYLREANAASLAEARCRLGVELIRRGRMNEGLRSYRAGLAAARRKWRSLLMLFLAVPGLVEVFRAGRRMLRGV